LKSLIYVTVHYYVSNVQRFFTNKITGCCYRPYKERLKLLSLHSLRHRRRVADLSFLHNIISGKICASLSPHLNYIPPSITRGHHLKNFKPNLHFSRYNQNFLFRTASDWNSFSNSILLASHPKSTLLPKKEFPIV